MGNFKCSERTEKISDTHRLGSKITDHESIDRCISVYVDWYNNGKKVSTTKCYPEERYSGQRDSSGYTRFVKALKLERILLIPVAVRG